MGTEGGCGVIIGSYLVLTEVRRSACSCSCRQNKHPAANDGITGAPPALSTAAASLADRSRPRRCPPNCDLKATRCTFEVNQQTGVFISGEHATAELVDCVIRRNGGDGLWTYQGKLTLRGGTVRENKGCGVYASLNGKVTVAVAEEDGLPQTILPLLARPTAHARFR